jgi:hypothetical protein
VSGRKFRSFKLHLGAMLEAPEDCSLAARLPVQTERPCVQLHDAHDA